MNPHKKTSAFTLIELLIVIAIIAILMALLFPAVGSAINSARKAQAQNDVTQIATALIAYETEYGRNPWGSNSYTEVKGPLLEALMGTNAREIVFLEVPESKGSRHGYFKGAFVDPWGGTYQVAHDPNYSSKLENIGVPATNKVRKNYAVWSDPDKQKWRTNRVRLNQRYVESW